LRQLLSASATRHLARLANRARIFTRFAGFASTM
jgi:hypothetical protein